MSRKLSRRLILRGAGATLALPWLESVEAATPDSGDLRLKEPPRVIDPSISIYNL